ncbi:threonine synthase [Paenibacillus filicis]|uniref:Threonine synthase n=1 Tax=Paenibacillus filicis TaxID=669464 RepID=A0ABU9DWD0_9BACL
MVTRMICSECGLEQAAGAANYSCGCGGLMEVRLEAGPGGWDAEQLRKTFDDRLSERGTLYASGVWRYKELIHPSLSPEFAVTRNEGNTGLYEAEPVRRFAGIGRLWLKAQSENPSGSFKDNGMTVAVSQGLSQGYQRFACSSTGNTSASLAMYAAWSGAEAYVFVPQQGVAAGKIGQTLAYGGRMVRFEGTYDDGIAFLQRHAAALGLYVCNSINPWRIEGQKSIGFEIAHQLGWKLPDWIVLPGGALSNVSALGKGLLELQAIGLIDRLPRIAVVQAEGAAPFHRLMEAGARELIPEPAPATRASALNIGNPPSWRKAAAVLKATAGVTVSVTDEEIFTAKRVVDRSGIGCEPASAASVAGLRKLRERGIIDPDCSAVCILTGHLLKDYEAMNSYMTEILDERIQGACGDERLGLHPDAVRALFAKSEG